MQLPDEQVTFNYQSLLYTPPKENEEWRPVCELQAQHYLRPERLKALQPQLLQVRSQVASEREMLNPPSHLRPLDSAFIDLPDKLLAEFKQKGAQSELGRIQATADRLRQQVDRVVILGIGGSYLGARTLFDALKSSYHNELPDSARHGTPRIYFEGNGVDNDAVHDLLELLQTTCLNPENREERWGAIVISKSGGTMETAAALRVFRREAMESYGQQSELLRELIVPVTGIPRTDEEKKKAKLWRLVKKENYDDKDIFSVPDRVGGRFSVFSAVGLLPAAVMGLDIRALLQGAAGMTRRFFDEAVDRNIVLQYAGVNYLMNQELGKNIRVMSLWSKKLEPFGLWHDQLLAESLGKEGVGPTPITAVQTRDLHSRGQQHQEGRRDKLILNVIVKNAKATAIPIGMADNNEDELNEFSRRTYPDMLSAALRGTNEAYADAARPTADIVLPALNEHAMGQVMQMLMLATVVEGRLMGVNPYGQPGVEAYKRNMMRNLKNMGNAPAGK